MASLVADSMGVKRVAALGYPFQNPREGPNPDHYLHLEMLRTPMLIIQGTRDDYGGSEIASVYSVSPSTAIEFVDGDHELYLDDMALARVLARVDEFFFGFRTK